jgi:hypothetical protein
MPLISKTQIQSQASFCGIRGGQSGTGTDISRSMLVSPPVGVTPSMLHTCSFIYYKCYIILAVKKSLKNKLEENKKPNQLSYS